MRWQKVGRRRWTAEGDSVEGQARVHEVEGGYRAEIHAEDTEFGMTLLDESDFFESERDAVRFLEDAMDED